MKVKKEIRIDLSKQELIHTLAKNFDLDVSKVKLEFIQEKYYPKSKYDDPRDPIDPQYRVVGVTLIEKQ
ncbi:MAG: hypothetical protein PQJ49_01495 [Sphaerochaetaceae bacterium]|nr:hypothetical protein [Sphaerochaetaceae bacterium]